jgi:hypothetical protein
MNGKNILEGRTGPITQAVESVKALLQWKKIASDPLPADVSMDNGRLVLVLSNKKDVYYTVTPSRCSCPSATYHPGQPCKHVRKYFPQAKAATKPTASEPLIERGGFRPFSLLPGEEKAKVSASSMLIDCHDTTALDVAYHSIHEDKIMWPAEA